MKSFTLLACAAVLGIAFSSTAQAQDVRVGVGVRVGSGRDGFSVRIGVGDRHDRNDRWDRWDRWDRRGRWDRRDDCDRRPPVIVLPAPRCEPPIVVYPAPRCEPPVVVVQPPCHAPIQVTITEIVGYRDERYISGYTESYQLVWNRHCRRYDRVRVDVPVYSIRQVPITATRVVTANWCNERHCYGYFDNTGCFQRVER